MSEEEFAVFLARIGKKPEDFGLKPKKAPAMKYRNRKVYVYEDGVASFTKDGESHGKILETFDSEKEYIRWRELQLLQRTGVISDLKRQQLFEIQPGFTKDGKKHRPINYKADFTYVRNDSTVVEDVKGLDAKTGKYITTKDFNLKWKMLQAKYPDLCFEIY